jgi:chloramphenicol 3-O phosphotransferase
VIVLLNGTSSSGKTTLAKALQRAMPTPYLHLGIDTVVFALPGRWLDAPAVARGVRV